ncbi:tetratricopeptide repeat protein [Ancylobacter sonchi]|uniref:tetratricopeptide repeat protein n=1 Tax=Ancylobacter sonchi TaxID=1937790 RepID=UPI001BD282C6|nr:tetratricopeptide repeat protein [Ancylobacter sonchi]MBS7534683.1 tetratricopeptide repeat protein [Ancylobacter sonchi]
MTASPPASRFDRAKALVAAGKPARAEALLQQILEASPTAVHALLLLADLHRHRDDRATAEQLLRRAWDIDPSNLKAGIGLVRLLLFRKGHGEAAGLLRQILAVAPRHTDALALLAELHQSADDASESEALLRDCLVRDPGHPALTLALVKRQARERRGAEADATLAAALAIFPDHPDLLIALGKRQLDARDDEKALATFERACRLPVPSASAWIECSRLVSRLISTKEGLAQLTRGIERCRDAFELPRELVSQLLAAGRIAEAERPLAAAIERFPDNVDLVMLRVRIDILTGRHAQADRSLARLPGNTRKARRSRTRLKAALLKARWRIDDALKAYRSGQHDDGLDPEDHRALAQLHLMAFDVPSAREALRETLPRQMRGTDARIPKGLLREIANDLWSDPRSLAAGQAARAMASVPGWIDALRANSHHTGCAIGFFIHLRQAGHLGMRAPARSGQAIPLHIHQFWDTPDLPEDVAELVDSWRDLNPGFSHTLLSLPSARDWLAQRDARWLQAFRNVPSIAGKADLLRLALLYEEGGVYADADDRCLAPLNALLVGRELVLRQEHYGTIGNNFIAARPRHPLIGLALQAAVEAALRGDRESIWLSSGPGLLTRCLAGWLVDAPHRMEMLGRDILVLDQHSLLRYCASNCKANYKHSSSNWRVAEFQGMPLAATVSDAATMRNQAPGQSRAAQVTWTF